MRLDGTLTNVDLRIMEAKRENGANKNAGLTPFVVHAQCPPGIQIRPTGCASWVRTKNNPLYSNLVLKCTFFRVRIAVTCATGVILPRVQGVINVVQVLEKILDF